jgi:hypothetical protein
VSFGSRLDRHFPRFDPTLLSGFDQQAGSSVREMDSTRLAERMDKARSSHRVTKQLEPRPFPLRETSRNWSTVNTDPESHICGVKPIPDL